MTHNIGDTIYWVRSSTNYGKTIPCTVCFGKKVVTIILGNGEHETSECGFCSHGFEYATGYCNTWVPHAEVRQGVITGISTRDGVKYECDWESLRLHEVFLTKEEAEISCAEKLKEETERAEKWFKDSYVQATKKQLWSHGYHKGCIERAERSIEWHKLRLGMIKNKEK